MSATQSRGCRRLAASGMPGYFAMPSGVVLTIPSAAADGVGDVGAGNGATGSEPVAERGRELLARGRRRCR